MKPFSQSPFSLCADKAPTAASPTVSSASVGAGNGMGSSGSAGSAVSAAAPSWQGRAIATHKLRLLEFSAFVEQKREVESYKHHFVHIGGPVSYADPVLEVRVLQYKMPRTKQTELYSGS